MRLNPTMFCFYGLSYCFLLPAAKSVQYFVERNLIFNFERKTRGIGRKKLARPLTGAKKIHRLFSLVRQMMETDKKNWFPLSEDVWQSAPSTFVHTSITAALTPAKWMSTSHHFIWLGDILLTFCPENATRGNVMQCPFILWGPWMCAGNSLQYAQCWYFY